RFTRGDERRVAGAISGPPTFSATTETEERHDSLGARRALGGGGGHFGAPHVQRDNRNRGAPRFTRGATSVGGCGGPFRGPPRQLGNRTAVPGCGRLPNPQRDVSVLGFPCAVAA